MSLDGKSVYVTSYDGDSIAHFLRDPADGRLNYTRCLARRDDAFQGCDLLAGESLADPSGVAVSPDGGSVYVSALGGGLTHFRRGLGDDTPAGAPGPGTTPDVRNGSDRAVATCHGKPATIVGTPGPDRLRGTPKRDVIAALGGNDRVSANGGADLVCGGDGNDTLAGGAGRDRLDGERGRDVLSGGLGRDRLIGGGGRRDRCAGGAAEIVPAHASSRARSERVSSAPASG